MTTCKYETDSGNCKNKRVMAASIHHKGPGEPPCDLDNQKLCLEYEEEK